MVVTEPAAAFMVTFAVDFEASSVVAFAVDLKADSSAAGEAGYVAVVASSAFLGSGWSFRPPSCLRLYAGLLSSTYLYLGLAVAASLARKAIIITFVAVTIVKTWMVMIVVIAEAACCSPAAWVAKASRQFVEVRHSALATEGSESVVGGS